MLSCEYCEICKNSFSMDLRWLLLVTATNRRYSEKYCAIHFCRYEGLCPAVQTRIHRGYVPWILAKFQKSYFQEQFWGLLLKRKQRRRRRTVTLAVSGFHFLQVRYLLIVETIFFLHKVVHSGAFQFGLCYPFLGLERAQQSSFYYQVFSDRNIQMILRRQLKYYQAICNCVCSNAISRYCD